MSSLRFSWAIRKIMENFSFLSKKFFDTVYQSTFFKPLHTKWKDWNYPVLCLVAQSCPTLCDPTDCSPPGSSVHEILQARILGVGCHALLQGIFQTQGSNPCLPHCKRILYSLSHQVSPRILNWVAYPFSRRSSHPRNRTGISCIAGRFFTNWATREAPGILLLDIKVDKSVTCIGLFMLRSI